MKYLISFKYDGSKFSGFQRQNDVRNVQKEMENTLSDFFKNEILIKGAGRTDRGVHATDQKAHFETNQSTKGLKRYLNRNLTDIKVKKIKRVDSGFHARFSVKSKRYVYKITFRKNDDSRYYLYQRDLDINKMKECSKLFVGTHDFRNFVSGYREDYTTTIFKIKFYYFFKRLYIVFDGVGFYRYMVRNLVGALIQVGKNKVSIEDINNMINCTTSKRTNTAPANGLYLVKIKY